MPNRNYLGLFFFYLTLLSCNASSANNSDITNDYILITTAISTSKESRLKFQNEFAFALDSFLLKDNPAINMNELVHLLNEAKKENKKAEQLVLAANEIDSTLKYREKAVDMFRFMDEQYNYNYPEVFKIMKSEITDKKSLIAKLIIPSLDSFQLKAKDVTNTANLVIEKYDINLLKVE